MEINDESAGSLAILGLLCADPFTYSGGQAGPSVPLLGDTLGAVGERRQVAAGGRSLYDTMYDIAVNSCANYGTDGVRIAGGSFSGCGSDCWDAVPSARGVAVGPKGAG